MRGERFHKRGGTLGSGGVWLTVFVLFALVSNDFFGDGLGGIVVEIALLLEASYQLFYIIYGGVWIDKDRILVINQWRSHKLAGSEIEEFYLQEYTNRCLVVFKDKEKMMPISAITLANLPGFKSEDAEIRDMIKRMNNLLGSH